MVVDLSVDAEDEFPVGADQRLPSGGRVYDGKAFMGQDSGFALVDTTPVRPPVTDSFTH